MTTTEILAILDGMDANVHSFRKLNDYEPASKGKRWSVALKAEKKGVGVEVKPCFGPTFDVALALAWAKFEPAVTGGLPSLAIEDASFAVVANEGVPF